MEHFNKKVKTYDFESEEEAGSYASSFMRGIPVEIWVHILSSNERLSIQDIKRMCRVNLRFNQLCASGIIWDKIFIRQFGLQTFQREQQREYLPDRVVCFLNKYLPEFDIAKESSLLRLFAYRAYSKGYTEDAEAYMEVYEKMWTFYKRNNEVLDISSDFDETEYVLKFSGNTDIKYITTAARITNLISEAQAKYLRRILDAPHKSKIVYHDIMHKAIIKTNLLQFLCIMFAKQFVLSQEIMKESVYTGKQCIVCTEISKFVCGGCKQRYFCSKMCAKNDWDTGHFKSCGL